MKACWKAGCYQEKASIIKLWYREIKQAKLFLQKTNTVILHKHFTDLLLLSSSWLPPNLQWQPDVDISLSVHICTTTNSHRRDQSFVKTYFLVRDCTDVEVRIGVLVVVFFSSVPGLRATDKILHNEKNDWWPRYCYFYWDMWFKWNIFFIPWKRFSGFVLTQNTSAKVWIPTKGGNKRKSIHFRPVSRWG